MTFEITQEKEKCIACGACMLCPDWEMEEGYASMKGMKYLKEDGKEIGRKEVGMLGCNQDAAESCPTNCIHIKDKETGRKLI